MVDITVTRDRDDFDRHRRFVGGDIDRSRHTAGTKGRAVQREVAIFGVFGRADVDMNVKTRSSSASSTSRTRKRPLSEGVASDAEASTATRTAAFVVGLAGSSSSLQPGRTCLGYNDLFFERLHRTSITFFVSLPIFVCSRTT